MAREHTRIAAALVVVSRRIIGASRRPHRSSDAPDRHHAWFGEQHERGVAMAVAELNEAGGLLGESI